MNTLDFAADYVGPDIGARAQAAERAEFRQPPQFGLTDGGAVLSFFIIQPIELREKQAAFVHQEAAYVAIGTGVKDTANQLFGVAVIGKFMQLFYLSLNFCLLLKFYI